MKNNLKAILLVLGLVSMAPASLAVNDDRLIQLDGQRNDLLKQITNELSYGHITIADAEKLKGELDQVVALETKYKEKRADQGHSTKLDNIAQMLNSISKDVKGAISPKKVWAGIDNHNMALKEKIDAAFASNKLTKQEAENLEIEEQTLRNRETVNDTTAGLEFDDALSIAREYRSLDKKIDQLSND